MALVLLDQRRRHLQLSRCRDRSERAWLLRSLDLFKCAPNQVPDGGSTAMLLGTASSGSVCFAVTQAVTRLQAGNQIGIKWPLGIRAANLLSEQ